MSECSLARINEAEYRSSNSLLFTHNHSEGKDRPKPVSVGFALPQMASAFLICHGSPHNRDHLATACVCAPMMLRKSVSPICGVLWKMATSAGHAMSQARQAARRTARPVSLRSNFSTPPNFRLSRAKPVARRRKLRRHQFLPRTCKTAATAAAVLSKNSWHVSSASGSASLMMISSWLSLKPIMGK